MSNRFTKITISSACFIGLFFSSIAIAHPDSRSVQDSLDTDDGVVTERLESERKTAFNPYVISTHKQNYILPVSYTSDLNSEIYELFNEDIPQYLNEEEVKFQLSFKVQLNENDLFASGDALFIGLTMEAWWQLYSKDVSSLFRETNYQPEIFYFRPMLFSPFGSTTSAIFGLEHQSNGQIQGFSRSWNRLYAGLLVEKDSYFGLVRTWYRLPEKDKATPNDPRGDDNPDILDFMGHGELTLGWRGSRYEFSGQFRLNVATGRGASELSMSLPLFGRFRGVIQYFNGYGDALVDYNHFQQRIGAGILLSNLF